MDHNRDGKLSLEELQSTATVLFKKWDTDENGTLDEQEIAMGINSLIPGPQPGQPDGAERNRHRVPQP